MQGLGNIFDIGSAFSPVDLNTANGATGHRVHLRNAESCTFVFIKAAGTAGEDPDLDVQEHTANTGGTSRDLDIITEFFHKSETVLDGDEAWVRVTQTAASEVDLGDASAEVEGIYVIHIPAGALSDDCEWISVNVAVTAAAAQLASGIYILHDLKIHREPNLLAQLNA